MNGYELSRSFWDYSFENPEEMRPIHSAIFFFAIEQCNRLGWKKKFGFPSSMVMDAIGIRKHQTYIKGLYELEEMGFITFIERSKNQFSSNIIQINALPKNGKAQGKALDKATEKHGISTGQSTGQSTDSIDKQINHELINKETNKQEDFFSFKDFWVKYPKKVARKKCEQKFKKLSSKQKTKIEGTLEDFINYKPFEGYTLPNPETYLNQERWDDEIPNKKSRFEGLTIEQKQESFKSQIITAKSKLTAEGFKVDNETLKSFYDHYKEPTDDRLMIAAEIHKTWETESRLKKWIKNENKFKKQTSDRL